MDEERGRIVGKIRGLMAMTVANGCTEQEELSAARKIATLLAQIGEADDGAGPSAAPGRRSLAEERLDRMVAEKATTESVLKAALMELAIAYINVVSPPARPVGNRHQPVPAQAMLEGYLIPMLGAGSSRMAAGVVRMLLADLIADGQLPETIAVLRDD